VPTLLELEQVRQGNPLAQYAALLDLEGQYRASPGLRDIYEQVRFMVEEFLGVPDAGLRAMNTIRELHRTYPANDVAIAPGFVAADALEIIGREASRTRLVIWGEEHHLPQTRSLYESLLRTLWRLGYRYLAAETFGDSVMTPGYDYPRFSSGVYVRDPVFAGAVRVALELGYRLVAYEEYGQGPPDDRSFRDRRQAENLHARTFARDSTARVLVLAGRGHAAEVVAQDGWTPMAAVLKRLTGTDPFTILAVPMGERLTQEEEDPRYRVAAAAGLLASPSMFVDSGGRTLGDSSFDAFVFWPRTRLLDGRPDWLTSVLGRRRTSIPEALLRGDGLRLVQAYRAGEPSDAIAFDQVLLRPGTTPPALMLPPGTYWVRTIDAEGITKANTTLVVPE
jgi:hypothetical protein